MQGKAKAGRADGSTGGDVSDNTAAATPTKHRTITIGASPARARATARVCEAASCISGRSSDITAHLAELTADAGDITIKRVGCLGLCAAGPLVEIAETGQLFEHVSPDAVAPIVAALKEVAPGATRQPQGPFFEKQVRVATENFGLVDPESLEDYLAQGGYRALQQGPLGDDLRRGPRPDLRQRPARSRRCRLSHRPQVDDGGQGGRRQEVRHLQRRRG